MLEHHRVLSQPVKVHFAGWESDTYRLQQEGWQLSAEQDPYRMSMRLAMKHQGLGLYALTEVTEWEYRQLGPEAMAYRKFPILRVAHMGRDILVQAQGQIDWNFQPIDAQPMFVTTKIQRLEDLVHFAPNLTRTKQIIVPEDSVSELLDRILGLQQPEREAHFLKAAKAQHDAGSSAPAPRQKFHAQILSLAA